MNMFNRHLYKLASHYIEKQLEKQALQPPMDPSQGGAPPGGDPSQGGAPPMDPSMASAPPDPNAGGAPPAPAPAPTPAAAPAAAPAQPGVPAAPNAKQNKDQMMQSMGNDVWQMKKYLFMLGQAMGVDPPPSLMDGPDRDPNTGAPMPPNAPGSTSDPAVLQQEAQQMQQDQGGQGGGSGASKSSIPPVQPIQGAMPQAPGGEKQSSKKQASINVGAPYTGGMLSALTGEVVAAGREIRSQSDALAAILRGRK